MVLDGDMILALLGGAVGGGFAQGLGAWFIFSRLKKVDRMDKKLDRLITFWRVSNKDFEKFWRENGGE